MGGGLFAVGGLREYPGGFGEVAFDVFVVVGVGVDDHRDLSCIGFFEQCGGGVLFAALLEPSGGVEFDGAFGLLDRFKNLDPMGKVTAVVDHAELFGQIKVSDEGVKAAGRCAFKLFPIFPS